MGEKQIMSDKLYEITLEEKAVTGWIVFCFCLKQCLDAMKRFWDLLNMHLNITVEHKTNNDNMCIHSYITSVHQHVLPSPLHLLY